jgi:hypothetical protein
LLTGRQPWETLDEKIAKLQAREDPALPSANVREDKRSAPETSTQLRRSMTGPLDSIVLMAMRFDPKQRYQSAADLASDLQRFLDGEALTAYHEPVALRSIRMIKRKRVAIAVLVAFLALGAFGFRQWQRAEEQKAEAAQVQAKLSSYLDGLENRVKAGAAPQNPPAEIHEIQSLKNEFTTQFAKAVAARPGHSQERDDLLRRGIRILDNFRGSPAVNSALALELADAYQKLGSLQEMLLEGSNRKIAAGTLEKAATVLLMIPAADPLYANARALLEALRPRIAGLGGTQPAPEAVPVVNTQPPAPEPPKQDAVRPKPRQIAKAPEVTTPEPPQTTPPQVAEPPKLSPAEMRELQNREGLVESKIAAADAAVNPIRASLAAQGQVLNETLLTAITQMHLRLDRANREIAQGEAEAARGDLAAAEAFATRALREVGR